MVYGGQGVILIHIAVSVDSESITPLQMFISKKKILLSNKTIIKNKNYIKTQLKKFNLQIFNNFNIYKNINILNFLRNIKKNINK